ncbi:MAG: TolC family protein, partial [Planctomycetota bacterium]
MFNVKKLKKGFFVSVNVLLITCLSSCAVGELIVGKIGRTVKFWKRGNEVDHKTRLANIGSDLAQIKGRQENFIRPLSLADTIEYVMHHNVDVMIEYQNARIKKEERDGANLKMLPGIIFDLERSKRDKHDTSKSKTKNAGEKSLDPSYSEDKNKFTISTKFAWDLVDFGISYLRSRQAISENKIAKERRRRTMQNLCLRTMEAYWDVQTSRKTMVLAEDILQKSKKAQKELQQNLKDKIISRQRALEDEIKLIEMEMKLSSYRKEYISNKAQLSALMGLAPGTDFTLQEEDFGKGPLEKVHVDFKNLEARAFRNRPELFEHDNQEKIAENEARIALASMFPSLALFTRHDRDNNPFKYSHNWYTVGLNSTFDLLSLPKKYSKRKIAFMQKDLAKEKRIALLVGIVAQIRLAELDYSESISEYNNSRKIYEKRVAILEEMRKAEEEGAERGNNILFAENTALGSQLKMLEAYSEMQTSRERLRNSIGEGPNKNQNDWISVTPIKFEPFKVPTISSAQKVSLEINKELALSGTPAHAEIKEPSAADSGAGVISPALNIRKSTERKSLKAIKSRNLKLPEEIEEELNAANWKIELNGTAVKNEDAKRNENTIGKNHKAAVSKKVKSLITKEKQQFSLPTFTSSTESRKSKKPVIVSDIDGSSKILRETEKNPDQNPITAAENSVKLPEKQIPIAVENNKTAGTPAAADKWEKAEVRETTPEEKVSQPQITRKIQPQNTAVVNYTPERIRIEEEIVVPGTSAESTESEPKTTAAAVRTNDNITEKQQPLTAAGTNSTVSEEKILPETTATEQKDKVSSVAAADLKKITQKEIKEDIASLDTIAPVPVEKVFEPAQKKVPLKNIIQPRQIETAAEVTTPAKIATEEKPALITEKANNADKLPAPQADAIPEKDIQPEQIKEEIIVKPAFAKIEPDKSSATVT